MAHAIPLVSAAALVPMIKWLAANGRDVQARLAEADLGYWPIDHPEAPIPLVSAVEFLRCSARLEGPDFPSRVMQESSVLDLARLGAVALGARTPREALQRTIRALPRHCTHEQIALIDASDEVHIREQMIWPFDAEALHLIHQFNTEMICSLLRFIDAKGPLVRRVEMMPHPEHGFDHLRACKVFDAPLVPTTTRFMTISLPQAVIAHPFRKTARTRVTDIDQWPPMRGDGTLSYSVKVVLLSMLSEGVPNVERVARAAGTSVRSLQRHLRQEGSSFSGLLDDVRRELALKEIAAGAAQFRDVSAALGFAHQTALTRAVRRWSGKPPHQLRA